MGIYGNITNTARTQFSFDKIYPNRKTMDNSAQEDGIYINRYVLVEYDNDGLDTYPIGYIYSNKGYYDTQHTKPIEEGIIFRSDNELYQNKGNKTEKISGANNYAKNYAIDSKAYTNSRGYDSTVWVKQYEEAAKKFKYVMIAELNTVVPQFDIAVEAPTQEPIAPYFDGDSTNVYYKLHLQPSWGFELGSVDFNEDAFAERATGKHKSGQNSISLTQRASGKNDYVSANKQDVQQLNVNLPAIGNMMSDAWDIIHGPNRDDSKVDSLQGRLDSFKSLKSNEIPIVYTSEGELKGITVADDSWIKVEINQQTNKLQHSHIGPVETSKPNKPNETPNFGDTFSIIDWAFDAKGHQANSSTHTVKIPQGSLTFGTEKSENNILVDLSFNKSTGAITGTRNDLDNIKVSKGGAKVALSARLSGIDTDIANEINRASDAEDGLEAAISAETTRATNRESELAGLISAETTRASGEEERIDEALRSEATRATAAENALSSSIQAEKERATGAETTIATNLTEETTRAKAKENELSSAISAEVTRAETAEGVNSAAIATERTRATGAEEILQSNLNTLSSNTAASLEGLGARIAANENDIAVLKGNGEGSINNTVAVEIAKIVNEDNNGKVDTLKEIANWISNDAIGAAEMATNINTLMGDSTIEGSVAKALSDAKDYADGLASNYDSAGSADIAEQNAKDYADGLAVNYEPVGSNVQVLEDAKEYADSLAENYEVAGAAETAEQNAKDYIDSLFTSFGELEDTDGNQYKFIVIDGSLKLQKIEEEQEPEQEPEPMEE